MIFSFKNVGTVDEAEIEVKGIALLAGFNDIGKSFLSKSIYSIIKTLNGFETYYTTSKVSSLSTMVNQIHTLHRQNVAFTQEKNQKYNLQNFYQLIRDHFISKRQNDVRNIISEYISVALSDVEQIRNSPAATSKPQIETTVKALKTFQESFATLFDDLKSDEDKLKNYFDKKIVDVFQSQLNSLSTGNKLEISIRDGETQLLNVIVNNNTTEKFEVSNKLLLKDVTIIETPTIIQLVRFISNSFAFFGGDRGDLIDHYNDLIRKLQVPSAINTKKYQSIIEKIKVIIGGDFKITETGEIVFIKNGFPIKTANVATGIKSFGILQLLLNSEYINESTLFIIDEPEVHLHPAWEIKYAEIIFDLSKMGIPILISSHSPYFIEAMYTYREKFKMNDSVKFYFGKKSDNGQATFDDVSTDLSPIYKALAAPMKSLFLE